MLLDVGEWVRAGDDEPKPPVIELVPASKCPLWVMLSKKGIFSSGRARLIQAKRQLSLPQTSSS